MRRVLALAMLVLLPWIAPQRAVAECGWPAWQAFKADFISADGRVIDRGTGQAITTSEGQAYAMLFALVANDPGTFALLLGWTQDNLAAGSLSGHLPAWKWGRAADGRWQVLDTNDASDADLWLAYDLLEAGRLWYHAAYAALGTDLLQTVAARSVTAIPGFGVMLLPGSHGFADAAGWRLNPGYLPPQLTARLADIAPVWAELAKNNIRLLLQSSPRGFAPDWTDWKSGKGWQVDAEVGPTGSYDAIRVYLWIGMLADGAPDRLELQAHFRPMAELVTRLGHVPQSIDTVNGRPSAVGPPGFSAALLPLLAATGQHAALATQRERLVTSPPAKDAYYDQVLALFGEGWDRGFYRFDRAGRLLPAWDNPCPR